MRVQRTREREDRGARLVWFALLWTAFLLVGCRLGAGEWVILLLFSSLR